MIESGYNTYIWPDPWLPNSHMLCEKASPVMNAISCVIELINLETHTWKEDCIRSLFDSVTASKIL